MSIFSENLRYLREKNRLSKNKLADLANVNQTTISRWENEEISPSLDNILDLATALNVTISELVGISLRLQDQDIELPKLTNSAKVKIVKNFFKEKGLLNDDEDISDETLDEIINFAKANKQYLVKKDK